MPSKQQAASSKQQATSPKAGPKIESPRWGLGPQATILGVLLRPVVHSVADLAPEQPQAVPEGSVMGAGGGPVTVSWDGIHSGNVWGPFPRDLPVVTLSTVSGVIRPQNSPKTAPNVARVVPGPVPWGGFHLGNVQAGFWSCFARGSPVDGVGCGLAPYWPQKRPQMASKWA